MKIVNKQISRKELNKMAEGGFGDLVKAVVDVEDELMVVGGELHSDEEELLLSKGSKQKNLWGINLYPEMKSEDFIEFDSMINIRPNYSNNSRGVEDKKIRKKIVEIVSNLVKG